ncbi:MAG: hypothetical protein WA761_05255 [Thermoplasmata archaeon]|jgi:hypothetical protein
MSASSAGGLEERVAALEQQLRDLRARLAVLEKQRTPNSESEHAADTATIRRKVTYDWQS